MTLEQWAQVSEIVTAASVLVAAAAYVYQRTQDKKKAALEEVKYYLDEIIPLIDSIGKLVKFKFGTTYVKSRIEKIEFFEYDWLYANYAEQVREQMTFNGANPDISEQAPAVFNKMEYFALHIFQNNNKSHPALVILQESFVQFVEEYATVIMALLFSRDGMYPNVRRLYGEWYQDVDRKTMEERRTLLQEALRRGSTGQ
jgi:hypothetical protein